jgi:hypothetical protein
VLRTNILDAAPSHVTLAECPSEEDFAARAFTTSGTRIENVPFPYRAKILIERAEDVSRFTAVHEPYRSVRLLDSARCVPLESGNGVAVEATFARDGSQYTDLFVQTMPGSTRKAVVGGLELTGRAGFVRFEGHGEGRAPIYAALLAGRRLRCGEVELRSARSANMQWPRDRIRQAGPPAEALVHMNNGRR